MTSERTTCLTSFESKVSLPNGVARIRLEQIRNLLKVVNGGRIPDRRSVVWPSELDRHKLAELDLEVRTRNCLNYTKFQRLESNVTVQQLMAIPGFGRKCLKDLLIGIENFLNEQLRAKPKTREPNYWDKTSPVLIRLFAFASELQEANKLSDVLNPSVVSLASKMGIKHELDALLIKKVIVGTRGPISIALQKVGDLLAEMTHVQQVVIEKRLLLRPPTSLESVGQQTNLTRERIRQLQEMVDKRISRTLPAGATTGCVGLKKSNCHRLHHCLI